MKEITKKEIKEFLEINMPFAVKPTKKAKTLFVNPFTSNNSKTIVIESLTESLSKWLKN